MACQHLQHWPRSYSIKSVLRSTREKKQSATTLTELLARWLYVRLDTGVKIDLGKWREKSPGQGGRHDDSSYSMSSLWMEMSAPTSQQGENCVKKYIYIMAQSITLATLTELGYAETLLLKVWDVSCLRLNDGIFTAALHMFAHYSEKKSHSAPPFLSI